MATAPLRILQTRPVDISRLRQPKENIPQTKQERDHIAQLIRQRAPAWGLVPPVPVAELRKLATEIIELAGSKPIYAEFVGVLINNELWKEQLATVPFERRLLLLPKCLRLEEKCPAPFDDFGLLCKSCGLCSLQDLIEEAERLGYAVLVAEGSAIVMAMIQTGKIEAIVGVSCLSVLEKAFPYMEAAAIPGLAIPLLQDDCINTAVDMDWVWDTMHLSSDDKTRRVDLTDLRKEIDGWFTREALDVTMGPVVGEVEEISRQWMTRAGKRWRPFLSVAVFQALRGDPEAPLPDDIKRLVAGVESFHKASLIHDDIMDDDATRYGEQTLHREIGVPVALTTGDLLIGEGYRLLESCQVSLAQRAEMLRVSAESQRELSRGQGAELLWARNPKPLTTKQVIEIFRSKTAPAFEASLRLGAIYAGQHERHLPALQAYSQALGIAYQIQDDLGDWGPEAESDDLALMRPSIVLAAAYEKAQGDDKKKLEAVWRRQPLPGSTPQDIATLCRSLKADERARLLLESYKDTAIRSLREVESANLKGLLRRVIGKIFNELEIKGWCKEQEAQNKAAKLTSSTPQPVHA